ncbi:YibE/F family protein [Clostridium sp. C105KSO13]|uniref:YibE/F family protein n=1 Tax=Clostridium sp. C105KSO13 TaxID=1776045 RepID=UPI00074074C7|nr:YibE/F family protein [Clostridium sp. C105KSO13]CUX29516.1 YibE/F-like protein [Clostridium sp. C105KSO13]
MANLLKKSMCIFSATKKRKLFCLLIVFYFAALIFAANDAWLYKTPVVKVTEAHTVKERTAEAARGKKDVYYKQVLHGVVLNGKWKSSSIILRNEYSSSGVLNQKYRKGDNILASVNGHSQTGDIQGLKRDVHLTALIGILSILLIFLTEKKGILTICTLVVNLGIFAVGLSKFLKGDDILKLCNIMSVMFAVGTLLLLNGFNKKSLAAIISTLCVLAAIMGIFDIVTANTEAMDYSTMEYLGSLDNPDDLFRAEVMLAGLGAIMDVAVTISAALGEIVQKNSQVTFLQLFWSGREIGYDIMGTMMNVLLFVFGCGLIPTFLIRMNNDVRFLTIVRLHIPYEICRFLIESIGIVLAIPISILIASLFMKFRLQVGGKK